MAVYQIVVVGTDGSESSFRAVERAAAIAADSDATLIIASGYLRHPDDSRAEDALREEAYKVHGNAPIYAVLREARDRAKAVGAKKIEERALEDAPVHALVDLADKVNADLLVVGNVGLNARSAMLGRVFSVPGNIASKAACDVLIVHTSG